MVLLRYVAGLLLVILNVGILLAQAGDAYDINAMGEVCRQKIGLIRPFSCLDGVLIPITIDDEPLKPSVKPSACDRPSFLGPNYPSLCKPNARVGRLPNLDAEGRPDPDVQNLFICRRYSPEPSPTNTQFEDIAIIQHRKSTGDTCFFQREPPDKGDCDCMREDGESGGKANACQCKIDTARIPPPDELPSETPKGHLTAAEFWLTPAKAADINCRMCHDSGPFVRSPYIMQAKKDNVSVVYPLAEDRPHNYRFVGKPFESWNPPYYIAPVDNPCIHCHVLGTKHSSYKFTKFLTGRERHPTITDTYASYPNSHTMPPNHGIASREEWEKLYKAHVDQIIACSDDNPDSARNTPPDSCNRQPFPARLAR